MLNRFLQELQALAGENALHKRYLLAVSGGADSTVMATLFHEAGLSFAIAHCNFHLRGADSDRDMRFVQQLAAQWQVPLYLQEFDTLTLQKNSGKSVEMVARELRYTWFSEIAGDYDFIVTAHQSTDAAETMLLNLCRGTGLKGLCGIPSKNGKIIRPMLVFTAEEIRQYAEDHHIAYVEDITNRDEEISRNRIRHSVIPQMETLNPQFVSTTATSRQILQRQYAYYQKHIAADIQKVVSEQNGQCRINRSKLAECDDLELVLYEILNEYGFPAIVSEKLSVNSFFQPGKQFFSDTHILLIDRDFLLIQPKANSEEACVNIVSQEELSQYFDIEEFEYQKDMVFEKNPDILYLPKDKLTFPLQIRSWRSGDYFYPLGTKGRQKLSDFFTDHKIDRFAKQRVQLLCHGDDILWLVGLRSSEKFKIDSQTTQYYIITDYGNI